jgi:hypothetical protein
LTVHQFPDRKREVASRRRTRDAVTIAKSAFALWLIPWMFWVSLIDALAGDDHDDERDGRGR